MIDKYYNGVIEQVYNHVGTTEKNIVMASYNNDFSIKQDSHFLYVSLNETKRQVNTHDPPFCF